MYPRTNPDTRKIALGAVITVLTLLGGLVLGLVAGNLVFEAMPGHNFQNINPIHVVLAAIPAITGFLLGSAAWGALMGRLADAPDRRRMALSGVLGFAPITLVLAIALQIMEPIAVQRFGALLPIHRLFTLFFVPTAFLIASVSAWAIGLGLKSPALAWTLLWRVGLTAALAFLVVNVAMEAFSWQVGAPRAAERFTMLTVMFMGNLGAALAGGGALGWLLSRK